MTKKRKGHRKRTQRKQRTKSQQRRRDDYRLTRKAADLGGAYVVIKHTTGLVK